MNDIHQFTTDAQTGALSAGDKFIEFIRNYPDGSQVAITWNFNAGWREQSFYDVLTDTVLSSPREPITATWQEVETVMGWCHV